MMQSKDVTSNTDKVADELVTKYRQRLVAMLTRLTRDPHRAEDLAQDALIIVIKKLQEGGIREPEKLSAYIYSTARFLYLGWLRKADNQVELRESMEEFESPFTDQQACIAAAESAQVVRISINELPKTRDREILTRSYINDQTKQEICEALFLSTEHYDRVLHRAKQRLKKIAEQYQSQLAVDV
tara:strand:- start:17720 stop:18274 length:555 start_codon:yes stop_codon:yes gene_type:complete